MSNYYILNNKAMKRLFIFGLVLASAFALTNCTEQVQFPDTDNDIVVDESTIETENPAEDFSIPFEVYANPSAETKTEHDPDNNGTKWVENDKIRVYHAKTTTPTTYVKHSEFTLRDAKEGLFGGALNSGVGKELGAQNNWYFLYPHSSSADTPDKAVVTIGANAEGKYIQTQVGLDSKAHIQGESYPMYGSQPNVNNAVNPRVKMKHLSALVAIKLVNETGNPITIEQLELEAATKNIVGEVEFNLTNTSPEVKGYGTSSKVAILQLKTDDADGIIIPAGTEAKFYIGVAPINDKFTIRVNGTAITKDQDIPLESGKVTTLKVAIPKLEGILTSDTGKMVTWPDATVPYAASINGESGISVYSVNNNVITISGYMDKLIGKDANSGVLPISFYAASKVTRDSDGKFIENQAKLKLTSITLDIFSVVKETITGESLTAKLGINTYFEPSLIGLFDNNLIILDEPPIYYYLDVAKAEGLLQSGLNNNDEFKKSGLIATDYNIGLIRSALLGSQKNAYKKLLDLARVIAPGQFKETSPNGEDAMLGSVLRSCASSSIGGGILRATIAGAMYMSPLTITLTTEGDVAFWGMNINQ